MTWRALVTHQPYSTDVLASRGRGDVVSLDTAARRTESDAYTHLQRHKMRELFASDAECGEQMQHLDVSLGSFFKKAGERG